MRLSVVDLGTNSTRLMVAEVDGGRVRELERHSRVTGLGRATDASGRLSPAGIDAVHAALADYREIATAYEPKRTLAVATSAVRDAADGPEFLAELRERFDLEPRLIDGATEARLTYLGARADYPSTDSTLVFDIGGGSTELIYGTGATPEAYTSLQLGVLRQSERHLGSDPPSEAELAALRAEVAALLADARERMGCPSPTRAIAVAGTPNTLAAIDLGIERNDRSATEGHPLTAALAERELARLAALPVAERGALAGLEPDRAPMIVTGLAIFSAVLATFEPTRTIASEHDILWGVALEAAAG